MRRTRGRSIWLASVLALCAASSCSGTEPNPPDDRPNVLFIVVDTLRADHLPAYGYENGSTPHLDRFAEDAVRYENAFANASWTRPSFASILSGRYASSHGVMAKPDALPDAVETLPETLHENGYQTAGYVTNFNVGPYFNFQQGFDHYEFLEPEFVLGAENAVGDAEFVYLCVPTPQSADGSADLSYLQAAAAEISPHLQAGTVVVNKSTVPVGSTLLVEPANPSLEVGPPVGTDVVVEDEAAQVHTQIVAGRAGA